MRPARLSPAPLAGHVFSLAARTGPIRLLPASTRTTMPIGGGLLVWSDSIDLA